MTTADRPPRRLHFELPGDIPAVMEKVRSIQTFLREAGCSSASAQQLAVVAEEILSNIVRDAWPDREPGHCVVDVSADAAPDAVHVNLRTEDDGVAFDPTAATPPNLAASLEDRAVGGLGIFLIQSMTDTQRYQRMGNRNIFEVSKSCPCA